jgi:hypothetical protein
MSILVDGKQVFSRKSSDAQLSGPVTIGTTGTHTLEVQATDSAGSFNSSITIKVN